MSRHSPYAWFPAYVAAAFETDFSRLYRRIDEALKAIDKRLDEPTKLDDAEFADIEYALRALQMLSTDEIG